MIDIQKVRDELTFFLRNMDILPTSVRGVTTVTENIIGESNQSYIAPENPGLKNVRLLTIDSIELSLFQDYTIGSDGIITLITPLQGGEAIQLEYDYGTKDKIYPDFPRDDLTLESFPRIGLALTSSSTEVMGIGGLGHITDIIMTIFLFMPVNKNTSTASGIGGVSDLNNYYTAIRNAITSNSKNFKSFTYITPISINPIMPSTNNKIIQISGDYKIMLQIE